MVTVTPPGGQVLHLVLVRPVVLGREGEGLRIDDARVSRRHVELSPRNGTVVCTDLGSRNGTFVAGTRLAGPVVLEPGQHLTLGDTVVQRSPFVAARPADPETSAPRAPFTTTVAGPLPKPSVGPVGGDAGTQTIVFSDIEDHTARVAALGDDVWFGVLEAHNRLVRDALHAHGGREVKTQGDGFMLAFASVRAALGCAAEVQRRLAATAVGEPLAGMRLRMGVHTGEAVVDDRGDLFGQHVIKAARISGLASGGQVLVSSVVEELARGSQVGPIRPWGVIELKGLDGVHPVFELDWRTQGAPDTLGSRVVPDAG